MVNVSKTRDSVEEQRKETHEGTPSLETLVGNDGDVYFFNPWDRHFEADKKPKTNKFEF